MSETKLKRQIIFVSGAYRSKYGIIGRAVNIWKAYQVGRRLVRQGYSCYIPHANTAFMDGLQSEDWFLEATLKMLPKCQIIYMMRNSSHSQGAIMEWREAKRRGMEIEFESVKDMVFLETMQKLAEAEDNMILYGDGSKPNLGRPINAIEPCTEPVTVPYKLEPDVKS